MVDEMKINYMSIPENTICANCGKTYGKHYGRNCYEEIEMIEKFTFKPMEPMKNKSICLKCIGCECESEFGDLNLTECISFKEKQMENKVIFENVEQATKFCIDMFFDDIQGKIILMKNIGYIRKSVVEEAEEMWMQWRPYEKDRAEDNRFITVQHKAIQYLKAENERLKK